MRSVDLGVLSLLADLKGGNGNWDIAKPAVRHSCEATACSFGDSICDDGL